MNTITKETLEELAKVMQASPNLSVDGIFASLNMAYRIGAIDGHIEATRKSLDHMTPAERDLSDFNLRTLNVGGLDNKNA